MNSKRRTYLCLCAFVLVTIVGSLFSKYIFVRSKDKFDGSITKSMAGKSYECNNKKMYNLAIACFYQEISKRDRSRRRRARRKELKHATPAQRTAIKTEMKQEEKKEKRKEQRIKDLKKDFRDLSRNPKYKRAGFTFLAANITDHRNKDLVEDYKISKAPAFMLFLDGKPFRDAKGKVIRLHGYFKEDQIDRFIGRNFSKFLKANRRCLAIIRQKQRMYSSWYPGWYGGFGFGLGYPGWYGGYGGWGGGCYGGCGGCW